MKKNHSKKMNKILSLTISLILMLSLCACNSKQEEPSSTQLANPWHTFDSLEDAEAYAGFEFGIPETVADSYRAVSYMVMNADITLLQVDYQNEDYEIEIRKSPSVGQDISGVYGLEEKETTERNGVTVKTCSSSENSETPNAVLTLFDYDGYAWSIYAANGYWGDSSEDFLNAIISE